MKKIDIINLLQSEDFVEEIISKLTKGIESHELIKNPRLNYNSSHEKFCAIELVKSQLKLSEFDYEDEDEEETYLDNKEYYVFGKRDSLIAGGSVASLIYEKIHGVKAVINDIDIFYYQMEEESLGEVESNLYENIISEKFNYEILETKEVGIVNEIRVCPGFEFNFGNIIKSFDLNCSKVGVNLSKRRIIFDESFVDFLASKEIKIITSYDDNISFTSFVRGVQKSRDFDCKFDTSKEIENHIKVYPSFYFIDAISEFEVVHSIKVDEELDLNQILVTKKRWNYWKENPEILLPVLEVVGENKIKLNMLEIKGSSEFDLLKFGYEVQLSDVGSTTEVSGFGYRLGLSIREMTESGDNLDDLFVKKIKAIVKSGFLDKMFITGCLLNKNWTSENSDVVDLLLRAEFNVEKIGKRLCFVERNKTIHEMTMCLLKDFSLSLDDVYGLYLKIDPDVNLTNWVSSQKVGLLLKKDGNKKDLDAIFGMIQSAYIKDLLLFSS